MIEYRRAISLAEALSLADEKYHEEFKLANEQGARLHKRISFDEFRIWEAKGYVIHVQDYGEIMTVLQHKYTPISDALRKLVSSNTR
jgi:hypothetical protein